MDSEWQRVLLYRVRVTRGNIQISRGRIFQAKEIEQIPWDRHMHGKFSDRKKQESSWGWRQGDTGNEGREGVRFPLPKALVDRVIIQKFKSKRNYFRLESRPTQESLNKCLNKCKEWLLYKKNQTKSIILRALQRRGC